ncbi:MAG: hypothetical protein R3296_01895 [Oleiphilaceae bacterium]|nr:hypothetical protein [Oleiphilaceae bacterium]
MKLHYLHTIDGTLRVLALSRHARCVELYIKSVREGVWALVALAGSLSGQPDRDCCQGPYHSACEAEAAVRRIAATLLTQDYRVRTPGQPLWALPAQRMVREIRDTRRSFSPCDNAEQALEEPV